MKRRLRILRDAPPGGAALDTAVSQELLDAVAQGEHPECLRLWRPGDALAFSASDRGRPGFPRAVAAARRARFEPFLRLAGGHAAVYTRATLAFAWTRPAAELRSGIEERFAELSALVAEALRRLGVDAGVGEIPGEYCPGAHSVHARGRVKLMGVGQRLVRGAAHVGGVIVVGDAARLREVLVPVYEALALDLDPATVGSVAQEIGPIPPEEVVEALRAELAKRLDLEEGALEPAILERARRRAARFGVPA